jgi:hypothetical protein
MYGVIFAVVASTIRLGMHYSGLESGTRAIILLHLLFVLLAVFFESNRATKGVFLEYFKSGMRGGVIYALIIAVFTWLFYSQLVPEIFVERNQALIDSLEGKDAKDQVEMVKNLFTPAKYGQGTFFGYFMITFCYSLLVAVLQTKVLARFRK